MSDPDLALTPSLTPSVAAALADDFRGLVRGLPRRVHLLGAGGAGLSGAARLLLARGHVLSGHDLEASTFTRGLQGLGVPVALGASEAAALPPDAEAVLRSAAIPEDDPQRGAARRRGLVDLKYSEVLGRLAPPRRTLAVAGTHGKTTATWMLHHALSGVAATRHAPGAPVPRPGALVGGTHRTLGTNALAPEPGGWFAVEACEYDRSFLRLAPAGALVTNVEGDHLDYYGSLEHLERAFARFVDRVHPGGLLVVGAEVPERVEACAPCEVWRLGRELRVDLLSEREGRYEFRLRGPGWATPPLRLRVPGAFNVENAALALALATGLVAREEGVAASEASACAAACLRRFEGVERRFEPWGRVGDVPVVHDYAHHPTEVAATLGAARRVFPGRALHVLFQPHQHSRTARFLPEFVEALRAADRVVVAEVYGARAHIDSQAAGSEELVTRLRRAGVDARLGGGPESAGAALVEGLWEGLGEGLGEGLEGGPGEGPHGERAAALVLGAGNVDRIREYLLDRLALRGPAPR